MNNIKKEYRPRSCSPSWARPHPDRSPKTETEETTVRIGSLKGPTSMGLVELMDQAEKERPEPIMSLPWRPRRMRSTPPF